MMPPNLERMIRLADEVFDVKSDPTQLAVNEEVLNRIRALHPYALNEAKNEDGPIAWILVIPTRSDVMRDFLDASISEGAILDKTMPGSSFDAIYLCSALVLPEHRRRKIAFRLTVDAVEHIRKDHPIASLFAWPFSEGGERLAAQVAEACKLPLLNRPRHVPSS